MSRITKEVRLKSLDTLLNARMAHTQWTASATRGADSAVEEDPGKCTFGKWLLEQAGTLGHLPEFQALDEPHRALHAAYSNMKSAVPDAGVTASIRSCSQRLIDRIDQLEKCLNRLQAD